MRRCWKNGRPNGSCHHTMLGSPEIDPTMPSRGFRRLVEEFSRVQTSVLVQLRTGHMPLSKHLFWISKASFPVCPSCWQGDESVHHYLFECITWRHERWHMGKALGTLAKSAKCVLNSKKGIAELLKFVGHTARFRNALGDVPQQI